MERREQGLGEAVTSGAGVWSGREAALNGMVKEIGNWSVWRLEFCRNGKQREGRAAANLGLRGVFGDCASSPRKTLQFPMEKPG